MLAQWRIPFRPRTSRARRRGTLAPWDIGAAQSVFIDLLQDGEIRGHVVDVGCGTGENALYLAAQGLDVTGVDLAPAAIDRALSKATERGVMARFEVADVLDLHAFSDTFDSGIDSGCFHVFDDDGRARYVRSLHGALHPGGRLFIMTFSDRQPGTWGPRRVTQAELRNAFSDGWHVDGIEPATFDINPAVISRADIDERGGSLAPIEGWLTRLTRI